MKAMIQTKYGGADVLHLAEVDRPQVPENGVLVRVYGAAVHAGDWHLMRGTPFITRLMFGGLRKPKFKTLGCDVAGAVEAVGSAVTRFKPGDPVFGDLSESGFGTFADYVCAPETAFALKPTNLTYTEAAAVPVSALAALQGLRDAGQLRAGQTVLVNGAGGGVGSYAVQMAKVLGAEVTAMCGSRKLELVRSLNPHRIIDSTQTDLTQIGQRYDLILDTAAYRSPWAYQPLLKPNGTYVLVGGSTARLFQVLLFGGIIGKLMQRRLKCLTSKPNSTDLNILKDWLEAGKIFPSIDRVYPLIDLPEAIRYVEQGQARGKVAISVE
jgi:NADPH:quinone reductase-like Zn-dependent oxidoreductase